MSTLISNHKELDSVEPQVPLGIAVLILFGVALGTIILIAAVQTWLPAMGLSLSGAQPQAYWDLARSAGIVAYLLMWLSVAFGLIITNRMARIWPGGPTAFDLHQFSSLLGLGFAVFHGLVLLSDQFINFTLPQILIPFASVNYKTIWVGLGQLAFYALIPITFSFYVRRQIGANVWRAIHYVSFIAFSMVTVHGLLAGSDTTNPVVLGMYVITGLSVVFLTLYRMATVVHATA
jgi:predicted ferric reductase